MLREAARGRPALSFVPVLDVDPDLVAGLPPAEAARAADQALAPAFGLPAGPWRPAVEPDGDLAGMLVLAGAVCRTLVVDGAESVELLGPGDVLQPWVGDDYGDHAAVARWHALLASEIAVLDERFTRRVAPWPAVQVALTERALQRSRSLALRLAIARMRRISDRVHVLLWHLADRFGVVDRHGVVVRLPLSHELIAGLVCAQRPPVSLALKDLSERDLVTRTPDRSWRLLGERPALGREVAGAAA